jgi:hypothetical protein
VWSTLAGLTELGVARDDADSAGREVEVLDLLTSGCLVECRAFRATVGTAVV